MNESIKKWYEQYADDVVALCDDLFQHPEIAFTEYNACKKTAEFMRKQGFEVTEFNAQHRDAPPNAMTATFGSGKPVIGILGEFDALPGLGNEPVPRQAPIPAGTPGPGHGCGHHLMGAGCAASAAALKAVMEAESLPGTVIYFGCPAEETVEGKVYMARDGLFDKLDLCFAWHPGGWAPTVFEASMQANTNLYFNFYGRTAHAAGNPEAGRSALDAAELMNVGVNYLREHVSDDVRMHYCYINAGEKPNIVPDFARLHYFVRSKSKVINEEVKARVIECARGAAIMTGTTMDWSLNVACYETLINHSLNRFLYDSAQKVPELEYNGADQAFAAELYQNAMGKPAQKELLPTKMPEPKGVVTHIGGSTDVGDVSHIVPTAQIMGAGTVQNLPAHHWTTTAASGSPIGHKAAIYAGKCLAQGGYDALKDPSIIEKVWAEFREARRNMTPYQPGLPE